MQTSPAGCSCLEIARVSQYRKKKWKQKISSHSARNTDQPRRVFSSVCVFGRQHFTHYIVQTTRKSTDAEYRSVQSVVLSNNSCRNTWYRYINQKEYGRRETRHSQQSFFLSCRPQYRNIEPRLSRVSFSLLRAHSSRVGFGTITLSFPMPPSPWTCIAQSLCSEDNMVRKNGSVAPMKFKDVSREFVFMRTWENPLKVGQHVGSPCRYWPWDRQDAGANQ